ncbi:putative macrolide-specific efflux protein [Corynebacterium renale]|uniref:HlyD family efflux transporter periplasmic adaptor subunit n=1 Tax=Corynebacterium renale TaxID=1724 RepID=UPI000DA27060|nr:HlyD family efflux transporter periplasmic adaptor subunit [Corynebacterium renale]SQG63881.1 putative macrolide-specific efflux protein [Corynebacterium renale]
MATEKHSRWKKISIIVAIIVVLVLALTWACTRGAKSANIVPTADVVTLEQGELETTVPISGTVASARTAGLYTNLSAPVAEVPVKVGDRVTADQIVARLDAAQLQRELDKQSADFTNQYQQGQQAVTQAQNKLSQLNDALTSGLNTEINAAHATARQANNAFEDAQRAAQNAAPQDAKVRDSLAALNTARDTLDSARRASLRASGAVVDAAEGGVAESTALGDAIAAEDAANRALEKAKADHQDVLRATSEEAAKAARAADEAWAAKNDADIAVAAAELNAHNQISDAQDALNAAQQTADAGSRAAAVGVEQLRVDLDNATVRAPFAGVVSSVSAQPGQPASGALLTVVDDSRLTLTAALKEADLSKVKTGDKVRFTTPATGRTEFTGVVRTISPVASAPEAPASTSGNQSGSQGTQQVTFPVEIEVTGKTEGLRVGASAKIRVITGQEKNTLTVPRDAVLDEPDGSHAVLVISGDENAEVGAVEKRPVEVGIANDVNIAVSGDIKPGERVLARVTEYAHLAGHDAIITTMEGQ